jgi:ABC-type transport system involved in multi-copper enzyme maturation permease subunit
MYAVWEITKNTLNSIVRTKVFILALLLAGIVIIFAFRSLPTAQMAADAGELEYLRRLQNMVVSGLFMFWIQVTIGLGLVLGAMALTTEVSSRTITTVLAKPVERWRFLLGKWLGVQIVVLAFGLVGLGVVAVVMWLYEADPSILFWIGVSRFLLLGAIFSSASFALSTISTPFLSGMLPVPLALINTIAAQAAEGVRPWVDLLTRGYRLLMPASLPENLLSAGFSMEFMEPPYGLYLQVLLENALYAVFLLFLACVVFSMRELKLK